MRTIAAHVWSAHVSRAHRHSWTLCGVTRIREGGWRPVRDILEAIMSGRVRPATPAAETRGDRPPTRTGEPIGGVVVRARRDGPCSTVMASRDKESAQVAAPWQEVPTPELGPGPRALVAVAGQARSNYKQPYGHRSSKPVSTFTFLKRYGKLSELTRPSTTCPTPRGGLGRVRRGGAGRGPG